MKIYKNFLMFNVKWLYAKLYMDKFRLKFLINITTRIIFIIENVMIWFLYVFISFCERTNYWINLTSYRISRVSYRILKKKI
jgi:hypothetical protein